ncbi:MAG: hypothetical protein LBN39_03265 [Planctomycetaceae bacterium]|jgi:hypothetical protein|nr:hypothetical protein [Planctomycetaceae bacterium]
MSKHKIARVVLTNKDNLPVGKIKKVKPEDCKPRNTKDTAKIVANALNHIIRTEYGKRQFEYVLTPGGVLDSFDFPAELQDKSLNELQNLSSIQLLQPEAEKIVVDFISDLDGGLSKITDYFVVGIDSKPSEIGLSIECVAVCDTRKNEIIHWTGKTYPGKQVKMLVRHPMDSHFITPKGENVAVLGCHDLSMVNARKNAKTHTIKGKLVAAFAEAYKNKKPDIVLHLPHTHGNWKAKWTVLKKELGEPKHYASGMNFFPNRVQKDYNRALLLALRGTQSGDVINFDAAGNEIVINEEK